MKLEIAELLEKFKSEPTPQVIPENFAELLFTAMRRIKEECEEEEK